MPPFGGSRAPSRLLPPVGASNAFPKGAGTYTSPDGAIVVPPGALDTWFAYNAALSQTTRRAMVVYGDSTSFGSGGDVNGGYSWLQRLRDRAASAGFASGGKGLFAGLEQAIYYDAPEINGIVSSTFTGSGDGYDTLVGSWLYDAAGSTGHAHVSQFRETNLRLWYLKRGDAGVFTYSISAAGSVVASGTISDAQQAGAPSPVFAWIPGLPTGTKTLTITNTGGGSVRVAIDGVNDTGLQVQKQAMSGMTFGGMFYGQVTPAAPYTAAHDGFRFQAPLGLVPNVTIQGSNNYGGMGVDTKYAAAARISPCLAVTDLGFNDLTNVSSDGTSAVYWTEYVRRFAAACRAAGVSGLVLSGQLPYNANWPTFGAARYNALKAEALAQGLAFVDHFYPVGGPSLSYAGSTSNPHLTTVQYKAQADYLWDNLLGVA